MTERTAILRNGGGWRGCWHGLCARRAPTIKQWSLDARSGDHTNSLAEEWVKSYVLPLEDCSQQLFTFLPGWLLNETRKEESCAQ